jgi:hypothetical protein
MLALFASIRRLPQRLLLALVQGYRLLLKPWVGNVCRFEPSCSSYALQALQRHGAAGGTALTAARLLRCQPWCQGGCDPVPERFPNPVAGLFTRLRLSTEPDAAAADRATRKLS